MELWTVNWTFALLPRRIFNKNSYAQGLTSRIMVIHKDIVGRLPTNIQELANISYEMRWYTTSP